MFDAFLDLFSLSFTMMETSPLCEHCTTQRALVYCKSDAARLCLSCDEFIHSANALSRRHFRSLICDRCFSQPSALRCLDDCVSLCQSCCCTAVSHRHHPVSCYSGSPSNSELTTLWASVLGAAPVQMDDNGASSGFENASQGIKYDQWVMAAGINPSSLMVPREGNGVIPCGMDFQGAIAKNSYVRRVGPLNLGLCDDNELCNNNGREMFGHSQRDPFGGGQDIFYMNKNNLIADYNGHMGNTLETPSSEAEECVPLQSSRLFHPADPSQAVNYNADQMLFNVHNNMTDLSFLSGNVCSSMSMSNLTGESSANDYQDCGVSPMFLTNESQRNTNMEPGQPQARSEAKMRYHEKKKNRLSGKPNNCASRKAKVDPKKRLKGRSTKTIEPSDCVLPLDKSS